MLMEYGNMYCKRMHLCNFSLLLTEQKSALFVFYSMLVGYFVVFFMQGTKEILSVITHGLLFVDRSGGIAMIVVASLITVILIIYPKEGPQPEPVDNRVIYQGSL